MVDRLTPSLFSSGCLLPTKNSIVILVLNLEVTNRDIVALV